MCKFHRISKKDAINPVDSFTKDGMWHPLGNKNLLIIKAFKDKYPAPTLLNLAHTYLNLIGLCCLNPVDFLVVNPPQ